MATRRSLLGAAGILALAACSTPGGVEPNPTRERAGCVGTQALTAVRSLGGAELIYAAGNDPDHAGPSRFFIDDGFRAQLLAWQEFWNANSGLEPADQLWTYGAWIDGRGRCDSWHHSGRALDLSRLRRGGQDQVSLRYDAFEGHNASEPSTAEDAERSARRLREYWRLAASLHMHFAYVLTYLFDGEHRNHIHVDNGRSGGELSRFSSRSRVQVQAVQAICTHVWDTPVALSGRWDRATSRASAAVLERIGRRGDVGDGQERWQAFLTASVRPR